MFVSLIFALQLGLTTTMSLRNNPHMIRLSHEIGPQTLFWPGAPPFALSPVQRGSAYDGTEEYFYASNKLSMPEHGGTHLDAPYHFSKTGWTVDEIPDEYFLGEACVVDAKDKANLDPDYQLQPEDLHDWEQKNGPITPDCILLINFGWAQKYPTAADYFGSPSNDPATFHFPGISPNTSKWLVENRKVRGVGVDTPSNDFGQSKTFRTHRILAANNWPGYENVNNLDKLKARGFMIIISPLKLVKGTGAPATIFAFDSKWNVASRANISFNFCGFTLLLVAVLHIMSRV